MKKNKQPRKVARKQLTNEIKLSLADKMIEVMDNFGQGSKNLQKEIKKASDKLSKKIAKKIKINKVSDMDLV